MREGALQCKSLCNPLVLLIHYLVTYALEAVLHFYFLARRALSDGLELTFQLFKESRGARMRPAV
jgi:hypothetical protein